MLTIDPLPIVRIYCPTCHIGTAEGIRVPSYIHRRATQGLSGDCALPRHCYCPTYLHETGTGGSAVDFPLRYLSIIWSQMFHIVSECQPMSYVGRSNSLSSITESSRSQRLFSCSGLERCASRLWC